MPPPVMIETRMGASLLIALDLANYRSRSCECQQ
jgi:hypothetical protein